MTAIRKNIAKSGFVQIELLPDCCKMKRSKGARLRERRPLQRPLAQEFRNGDAKKIWDDLQLAQRAERRGRGIFVGFLVSGGAERGDTRAGGW